MTKKLHCAIFIDNRSEKGHLLESLLDGDPPMGFDALKGLKGALFSKLALEAFMEEEERHDTKILTENKGRNLKTFSSGEQKKALLRYILQSEPDYIVLDNPFDNLDVESQDDLKKQLEGDRQKHHPDPGHQPQYRLAALHDDICTAGRTGTGFYRPW